jgi:chromosome segregation ATPase
MNEAITVGLITGILGVLGGAGFWGYMASRKEAPIKKRDADIAAAHQSQQMALAVADDLREDVNRLRGELGVEREERQKLSGRVQGLETHIRELNGTIRSLREAIRAFRDAWDDITRRWAEIRLQDEAPPMPYTNIE